MAMSLPAGISRASDGACPLHSGMKSDEPLASAAARSGWAAPAARGNGGASALMGAHFADVAIDDRPRRSAAEQVGERGAVVVGLLQRSAMQRHGLGFRRQQEGRAHLHARRTKSQ